MKNGGSEMNEMNKKRKECEFILKCRGGEFVLRDEI
jgi:hypothetical protein